MCRGRIQTSFLYTTHNGNFNPVSRLGYFKYKLVLFLSNLLIRLAATVLFRAHASPPTQQLCSSSSVLKAHNTNNATLHNVLPSFSPFQLNSTFRGSLNVGIDVTLTRAGLNCNCIFRLNLSGQLPLRPSGVLATTTSRPYASNTRAPGRSARNADLCHRFARARLLRILQMCINRKEIILELEQYVC